MIKLTGLKEYVVARHFDKKNLSKKADDTMSSIYQSAFNDEIEKIALSKRTLVRTAKKLTDKDQRKVVVKLLKGKSTFDQGRSQLKSSLAGDKGRWRSKLYNYLGDMMK